MRSLSLDFCGLRFGAWKTTGRWKRNTAGARVLEVRCKCGKQGYRPECHLKAGRTLGCHGCANRRRFSVGQPIVDPKLRLRWRHVWWAMKRRCSNPEDPHYPQYGARGIRVAAAFKTFEGFSAYIITLRYWRQLSHQRSLDRIDNNSGYRPGNLRMATLKQQHSNRRGLRARA